MKSSKALDIHIIEKHVHQSSLKNSARNSNNTLLISPVEREMLFVGRSAAFTSFPKGSHQHQPTNADGDSKSSTLSLWADYLAEVFQDEDIDTNYAAIDSRLQSTGSVETKERRTVQ
ncbi:hypothetical protein JG688_00013030 [Phytophthora aleatoria]|uniref:Uncharacterized protein n=1 Tax=Phytophthora aleatoria TaxID=2496075 RepID=A0A8J5LZ52_9STRA|nr:hypothetical protein JG688_00013030 [Phytophthora aleatoria]